MAIETELKLRLSPTDLACLRRHGVFKLHRITDPVTRRLHNIYYDTPELGGFKYQLQQSMFGSSFGEFHVHQELTVNLYRRSKSE